MTDQLKLEADATEATTAAAEFEAAVQKIATALNRLSGTGKGAFNTLKNAQGELDFGKTAGGMNQTKSAAEGMATATRSASTASTKLSQDTSKLAQENQELLKRLQLLEKQKRRNSVAATNLSGRLRQTATTVAVMHGPLGGIASRLTGIATLFANIGVAAGGALLTIGALGTAITLGTRAFAQMEVATLRMEAAIKANGEATGFTLAQHREMARTLGRDTLTSANEARQAIAVLSTAAGLQGDQFERALRISQDLSDVYGTSLKQNSRILASAFGDPARALSRLERYTNIGEEMKETIKSLAQAGENTKAFEMLLGELESRVGGVSEAMSKSLSGSFDTFLETSSELMEAMTKASGITEIFTWVLDANADAFQRWTGKVRGAAGMDLDAVRDAIREVKAEIAADAPVVGPGGSSAQRRRDQEQRRAFLEDLYAQEEKLIQDSFTAQMNAIDAQREEELAAERKRAAAILDIRTDLQQELSDLDADEADIRLRDILGKLEEDGVTPGKEAQDRIRAEIRAILDRQKAIEDEADARREATRQRKAKARDDLRLEREAQLASERRQKGIQALVDSYDPLGAAARQYHQDIADLRDVEWDSIDTSMTLAEALEMRTKAYEAQADPFQNLLDSLREEQEVMGMGNKERRLHLTLQEQITKLTDKNIEVTDEMRAKLEAVNAEMDNMQNPRGMDAFFESMGTTIEMLDEIERTIAKDISGAISDMVMDGEFNFQAMIDGWTRMLVEMSSQELIRGLLGGSGGALSGGLASLFGTFGTGGEVTGGTAAGVFSEGGISTSAPATVNVSPSLFGGAPQFNNGTANTAGGIPAILHPNEAVIPLSGNRKVPVEMNGGGGDNISMQFVVNTPNPDAFRASRRQIENDMASSLQRARNRFS